MASPITRQITPSEVSSDALLIFYSWQEYHQKLFVAKQSSWITLFHHKNSQFSSIAYSVNVNLKPVLLSRLAKMGVGCTLLKRDSLWNFEFTTWLSANLFFVLISLMVIDALSPISLYSDNSTSFPHRGIVAKHWDSEPFWQSDVFCSRLNTVSMRHAGKHRRKSFTPLNLVRPFPKASHIQKWRHSFEVLRNVKERQKNMFYFYSNNTQLASSPNPIVPPMRLDSPGNCVDR